MPYTPVPAAPFSGGLNLRDSYEVMQPSQAYDLLNVTFDSRGGVRSRDGYERFAPQVGVTAVDRFDSLSAFYKTDGTKHLVCGAANNLEVYSSSGAAVTGGATSAPTASPHFFARFGGPTKTVVYAANGTDPLRHWDGLTWSIPTRTTVSANFSASATTITVASTSEFPSSGQIVIGTMTITYTGKTATTFTGCTGVTSGGSSGATVSRVVEPKGKFVAVTPWDNRLMNARLSGSVGGNNPSSVRFSDPSDPNTWGADNWFDLTPGDGEEVMGMCSFDNYVFVFKQTKFFVVYGTSLAIDGTPEINYRSVDSGKGLAAYQALCVGPEGVYFMADDGIYRTNGGAPQKVSENIDPLFYGDVPVLYGGSPINFSSIDKARLAYHNGQVFVSVPTGGSTYNDTILVYDPAGQWWTVWGIAADAITTFKIGSRSDLVFGYSTGDQVIGRIVEGLATDNGGAMESYVKTAFTDLGSTNHKTIRESKVWGVGEVRYSIVDDFDTASRQAAIDFGEVKLWANGSDNSDKWGDGTSSDLWTTGAAVKPKMVRQGTRGAYVSVELRNAAYVSPDTPPAWAVSRIIHHLREQRTPQVTTLDGE